VSARAEPGAALTLGDVAVLEGPDAQAMAARVVVPGSERPSAVQSVSLEQVRKSLEESGRVNWGRISLRGSQCRVSPPPAPPSLIAAAARPGLPASPALDDSACLRGAILRRIGQLAQASPTDLHITFAPEDSEFLALPIAGRTAEVKATAMSERLPLAVTLYEGERIVSSRTIRVTALIRRMVPMAADTKRKGDTLDKDDLSPQEQWLPLGASPANPDQLVGAVLRSRITAGQVISTDDVAPPLVANKGDQVTVHCISGGVVVTTRARAMAPAHDGEVIEFQALDSKRRFSARMNGRGRAVVTADGGPENTR
jgi:flagella basal body P-ring formation protein FlgA